MASIAEALSQAVRHHQAGSLAKAEQLYREILLIDPGHARTLQLLGVVACQTGRLLEAVGYLRQSLARDPLQADAHSNLGVASWQLGWLDDAVACFREAVRLKPDYPEAHNNLGNALKEQGLLDEAVACFQQAVHLNPDYAEAHTNLGVALHAKGRVDEAVACYRRALQLNPGHAEAHNHLGVALQEQGLLDEAIGCLRQVLILKPDYVEAHYNLGIALQEQGLVDEAIASCRQAVRLKPDYVQAHKNLSVMLLLKGNFEEGWPEYEWRSRMPVKRPRVFSQPRWDGSPLLGRTLLLHAEQGLGDTLQFIRYASGVARDGGRVIVECEPPLLRLLAGLPGIDEFVPQGSSLPDFDVQVPLPSLPGIFGTTLASIPAKVPYLGVNADLAEHWRREMESIPGFKVGVAWQGNPAHKRDRSRSAPLAQFAALAEVPGVDLCSVQVGPKSRQLAEASFTVHDLGSRFADFADVAAAMENMNLIVCVDSPTAHLAGALGKPVWVALPFVPDWRWLLERQDSPWYPTMRLFRQERPGDWQGVFAGLADALRQVREEHP